MLGDIGGLAASAAFDLTGAGAIIALPLGLSSADNIGNGAKKLWSGQVAPSNLVQAASYLGIYPKTAEDALFALDIAGPLGASRAIPKLLISSNRLFGEAIPGIRQGLQRHGFFGRERAEALANRAMNRVRLAQEDFSATSPNAAEALARKYRALEGAQTSSVRTETLSDGRIKYYDLETPSAKSGPTRGSAYVTEYNPRTVMFIHIPVANHF